MRKWSEFRVLLAAVAAFGVWSCTTKKAGPAIAASPEAPYARAAAQPRAELSEVPASFEASDAAVAAAQAAREPFDTEAYARIDESPFRLVTAAPLSTFSIDVDTASYANVRRFLTSGVLPPADAVRIEELLNYFPYDYAGPERGEPFAVHAESFACPWRPEHRLVRVAIKARELPAGERPAGNLVFLLDVSGSMDEPNKLPLVRRSLRLLVEQLGADDRVAIVVYAGASGVVLPPTPGSERARILRAIDRLEADGSTNGGAGIQLAYALAEAGFREGATNRVILATDGDFNVGVTSHGELTRLIEEKAKTGVFLSVLGFGAGNLNDATMEQLADRGNGNYAYIDTLAEARKVLVRELSGTLIPVAKDVKIQVEWNPAHASAYRLIGYENRALRDEDFTDDAKDAGEIGAGHAVTALYEVVPPGAPAPGGRVEPLRYQTGRAPSDAAFGGELATVKLRWKAADADEARALAFAVRPRAHPIGQASADARFAAAVAEFGMLLRGSEHRGSASYEHVIALARPAIGRDTDGYRREFVELVRSAWKLEAERASAE